MSDTKTWLDLINKAGDPYDSPMAKEAENRRRQAIDFAKMMDANRRAQEAQAAQSQRAAAAEAGRMSRHADTQKYRKGVKDWREDKAKRSARKDFFEIANKGPARPGRGSRSSGSLINPSNAASRIMSQASKDPLAHLRKRSQSLAAAINGMHGEIEAIRSREQLDRNSMSRLQKLEAEMGGLIQESNTIDDQIASADPMPSVEGLAQDYLNNAHSIAEVFAANGVGPGTGTPVDPARWNAFLNYYARESFVSPDEVKAFLMKEGAPEQEASRGAAAADSMNKSKSPPTSIPRGSHFGGGAGTSTAAPGSSPSLSPGGDREASLARLRAMTGGTGSGLISDLGRLAMNTGMQVAGRAGDALGNFAANAYAAGSDVLGGTPGGSTHAVFGPKAAEYPAIAAESRRGVPTQAQNYMQMIDELKTPWAEGDLSSQAAVGSRFAHEATIGAWPELMKAGYAIAKPIMDSVSGDGETLEPILNRIVRNLADATGEGEMDGTFAGRALYDPRSKEFSQRFSAALDEAIAATSGEGAISSDRLRVAYDAIALGMNKALGQDAIPTLDQKVREGVNPLGTLGDVATIGKVASMARGPGAIGPGPRPSPDYPGPKPPPQMDTMDVPMREVAPRTPNRSFAAEDAAVQRDLDAVSPGPILREPPVPEPALAPRREPSTYKQLRDGAADPRAYNDPLEGRAEVIMDEHGTNRAGGASLAENELNIQTAQLPKALSPRLAEIASGLGLDPAKMDPRYTLDDIKNISEFPPELRRMYEPEAQEVQPIARQGEPSPLLLPERTQSSQQEAPVAPRAPSPEPQAALQPNARETPSRPSRGNLAEIMRRDGTDLAPRPEATPEGQRSLAAESASEVDYRSINRARSAIRNGTMTPAEAVKHMRNPKMSPLMRDLESVAAKAAGGLEVDGPGVPFIPSSPLEEVFVEAYRKTNGKHPSDFDLAEMMYEESMDRQAGYYDGDTPVAVDVILDLASEAGMENDPRLLPGRIKYDLETIDDDPSGGAPYRGSPEFREDNPEPPPPQRQPEPALAPRDSHASTREPDLSPRDKRSKHIKRTPLKSTPLDMYTTEHLRRLVNDPPEGMRKGHLKQLKKELEGRLEKGAKTESRPLAESGEPATSSGKAEYRPVRPQGEEPYIYRVPRSGPAGRSAGEAPGRMQPVAASGGAVAGAAGRGSGAIEHPKPLKMRSVEREPLREQVGRRGDELPDQKSRERAEELLSEHEAEQGWRSEDPEDVASQNMGRSLDRNEDDVVKRPAINEHDVFEQQLEKTPITFTKGPKAQIDSVEHLMWRDLKDAYNDRVREYRRANDIPEEAYIELDILQDFFDETYRRSIDSAYNSVVGGAFGGDKLREVMGETEFYGMPKDELVSIAMQYGSDDFRKFEFEKTKRVLGKGPSPKQQKLQAALKSQMDSLQKRINALRRNINKAKPNALGVKPDMAATKESLRNLEAQYAEKRAKMDSMIYRKGWSDTPRVTPPTKKALNELYSTDGGPAIIRAAIEDPASASMLISLDDVGDVGQAVRDWAKERGVWRADEDGAQAWRGKLAYADSLPQADRLRAEMDIPTARRREPAPDRGARRDSPGESALRAMDRDRLEELAGEGVDEARMELDRRYNKPEADPFVPVKPELDDSMITFGDEVGAGTDYRQTEIGRLQDVISKDTKLLERLQSEDSPNQTAIRRLERNLSDNEARLEKAFARRAEKSKKAKKLSDLPVGFTDKHPSAIKPVKVEEPEPAKLPDDLSDSRDPGALAWTLRQELHVKQERLRNTRNPGNRKVLQGQIGRLKKEIIRLRKEASSGPVAGAGNVEEAGEGVKTFPRNSLEKEISSLKSQIKKAQDRIKAEKNPGKKKILRRKIERLKDKTRLLVAEQKHREVSAGAVAATAIDKLDAPTEFKRGAIEYIMSDVVRRAQGLTESFREYAAEMLKGFPALEKIETANRIDQEVKLKHESLAKKAYQHLVDHDMGKPNVEIDAEAQTFREMLLESDATRRRNTNKRIDAEFVLNKRGHELLDEHMESWIKRKGYTKAHESWSALNEEIRKSGKSRFRKYHFPRRSRKHSYPIATPPGSHHDLMNRHELTRAGKKFDYEKNPMRIMNEYIRDNVRYGSGAQKDIRANLEAIEAAFIERFGKDSEEYRGPAGLGVGVKEYMAKILGERLQPHEDLGARAMKKAFKAYLGKEAAKTLGEYEKGIEYAYNEVQKLDEKFRDFEAEKAKLSDDDTAAHSAIDEKMKEISAKIQTVWDSKRAIDQNIVKLMDKHPKWSAAFEALGNSPAKSLVDWIQGNAVFSALAPGFSKYTVAQVGDLVSAWSGFMGRDPEAMKAILGEVMKDGRKMGPIAKKGIQKIVKDVFGMNMKELGESLKQEGPYEDHGFGIKPLAPDQYLGMKDAEKLYTDKLSDLKAYGEKAGKARAKGRHVGDRVSRGFMFPFHKGDELLGFWSAVGADAKFRADLKRAGGMSAYKANPAKFWNSFKNLQSNYIKGSAILDSQIRPLMEAGKFQEARDALAAYNAKSAAVGTFVTDRSPLHVWANLGEGNELWSLFKKMSLMFTSHGFERYQQAKRTGRAKIPDSNHFAQAVMGTPDYAAGAATSAVFAMGLAAALNMAFEDQEDLGDAAATGVVFSMFQAAFENPLATMAVDAAIGSDRVSFKKALMSRGSGEPLPHGVELLAGKAGTMVNLAGNVARGKGRPKPARSVAYAGRKLAGRVRGMGKAATTALGSKKKKKNRKPTAPGMSWEQWKKRNAN